MYTLIPHTRQQLVIVILLCLAVLASIAFASDLVTINKSAVIKPGSELRRTSASADLATLTYRPSLTSLATDVPNPDRGAMQSYEISGVEKLPPGYAQGFMYERPEWNLIESSSGNINTSWLELKLGKAQAQKRKLGLRIMAYFDREVMPDWSERPVVDDAQVFNSENFLWHIDQTLSKLSRYNSDPRLGWVEVGFYSNFGEWSNQLMGKNKITTANAKRIITAHINAFKDKTILMPTDSSNNSNFADATDLDNPFKFAMAQTYVGSDGVRRKIGLRRDSVGNWTTMDLLSQRTNWTHARDRYKEAPFIGETMYLPSSGDFCLIKTHVDNSSPGNLLGQYHLSSLSSHNYANYASLTTAQKDCLIAGMLRVGYRYATKQVSVTAGVGSYTIATTWVNQGNSPTYNSWAVYYQFVNKNTGQILSEQKSNFDLRSLTDANQEQTLTESFIVASSDPLTLKIVVKDVAGYYPNMRLAQSGGDSANAHSIGELSSQTTTNAPSPSAPTTTPSNSPTPTSTPSTTPTSTSSPTPTRSITPSASMTRSPSPTTTTAPICTITCNTKSLGDSNCDGAIRPDDYSRYVSVVNGLAYDRACISVDFNGDGEQGLRDRCIVIRTLYPDIATTCN